MESSENHKKNKFIFLFFLFFLIFFKGLKENSLQSNKKFKQKVELALKKIFFYVSWSKEQPSVMYANLQYQVSQYL